MRRMSDRKKVLAFAREPGGADTIAPVIGQLLEGGKVDVVVLAKEYARARFAVAGLSYEEVVWADEPTLGEQVGGILADLKPDVLLTSASSRPQDDLTEKYFWKYGADLGIPSLAVLDQWQNYILRFSGPHEGEKLAYMPSCVAVMDEGVRKEMVAEGFPDDRLYVSGHPRFDVLHAYKSNTSRVQAREKVAAFGIDTDALLLSFVSEPARRFFAQEEGFDEAATFSALLDACRRIETDQRLEVVLKYHPRNIFEDFADLPSTMADDRVRVHHIQNEIEPCDLLLASDLVVGMISILLVDSVLLGVPTLSAQLGGFNHGRCVPEKYDAISVVRNTAELDCAVRSLLTEKEFREQYLLKQTRFSVARDAIMHIKDKVFALAGVD
jgi:hypothetical protein